MATRTRTLSRWTECLPGLCSAALLLLLVPGMASAEDATKYRDEINQYGKRVIELRSEDGGNTLSKELQQVEGWLDEALVQLGKEEFNAVKALLRRGEVQLDYVTAKLEWQKAVASADAKERALDEAKEQSRQLKDEHDQLRAREKGLQEQLSQSR